MRGRVTTQIIELLATKATVLGADLGGGKVDGIVEREQVVGHEFLVILPQVDPLFVTGDRLVDLPLVEVGVAQVGVRGGEVGLQADRLQQRLLGQVGKFGLAVEVAQIGIRLVVIRPGGDRLLEGLQPLLMLLQAQQHIAKVVQRLGKIRLQGDRLAQVAGALLLSAHLHHEIAHGEMGLGAVGLHLQRLRQPPEGSLQVAGILREAPQIDTRVGHGGILGQRGLVAPHRLFLQPQLLVCHAQVVESLGENRLQLDRLLQRRAGRRPILAAPQAIRQVEPARRLIRRQFNRLARGMFRLGHLIQPQVGCRQLVPAREKSGVQIDRLAVEGQGLRPFAPQLVQVAQVVMRHRISRQQLNCAQVGPLRIVGPAHVLQQVGEIDPVKTLTRIQAHRRLEML